jgi:hypothetical protein
VIFKTITNFKTDLWASYGNVKFFEADTMRAADTAAREAILSKHPDAFNIRVEITESTPRAKEQYDKYLRQLEEWRENVKNGVPQTVRF